MTEVMMITGWEIELNWVTRMRMIRNIAAPNSLDKVTLPSAAPFNSGTPEIVQVKPTSDENGIHHVVLWVK